MIEHLPAYVPAFFILTTLATVGVFFYIVITASVSSQLRYVIPGIVSFWLIFQATLANLEFYETTDVFPPRIFVFGALPALLFALASCFLFRTQLIDRVSLRALTLLSVIRIPVEITLYWLAANRLVPETMTFTGRNFDILSGLSAPLVAYFAFAAGRINRPLLLAWNVAALLLLVNVVTIAVLAFPSKIQSMAIDQPNLAVVHFPFVWLPSVVVPIVFFTHAAAFVRLLRLDGK